MNPCISFSILSSSFFLFLLFNFLLLILLLILPSPHPSPPRPSSPPSPPPPITNQILLGLKERDDEIVAATLHALSCLVPILGSATVMGTSKTRRSIFTDSKPKVGSFSSFFKIFSAHSKVVMAIYINFVLHVHTCRTNVELSVTCTTTLQAVTQLIYCTCGQWSVIVPTQTLALGTTCLMPSVNYV